MFVALAVIDSFLCRKIRTNKRDIIERLPTSFTKLPKLCKVDTNSFSLITYAKTIFEMRFNESFFDFFFLKTYLQLINWPWNVKLVWFFFLVFFFCVAEKFNCDDRSSCKVPSQFQFCFLKIGPTFVCSVHNSSSSQKKNPIFRLDNLIWFVHGLLF